MIQSSFIDNKVFNDFSLGGHVRRMVGKLTVVIVFFLLKTNCHIR